MDTKMFIKLCKNFKGDFHRIKSIISEVFNIKPELIDCKSRKREIVIARQASHFYAMKLKIASSTKVGKFIGNKDHATVLHSVKTIENLREYNKDYKNEFKKLDKIFNYKQNNHG